MTFVFPFLLGGLVLVGIPVLIHLIMRQKPKSLPFPAFRFLLQKQRTNQRKLRLRHLLLLALRVLLIAAACLALARPKVFNEALKLGSDRPVAAVLVFDTRPSMEYVVSSARGKLTRLDDAKRRGHELLNQLPDGSKVLILDSADPAVSGKGEWLVSLAQARKRIDGLRIRPGGGPVTARIEDAYRLFDGLAHAKNDEATRRLARLLVVFSDRTAASWDTSRLQELHGAQDRVPPPFERLPSIRDRVPGVVEVLGELRSRLPLPPGQDFPEKALIDLLEKARDRASGLSEDEYPDRELSQQLAQARARARELIRAVDKLGDELPAAAKDYRGKLLTVLRGLLHETRGVHEVYLDVGVDNPADGALLDFELPRDPRRNAPRQVFAADEKVTVRAVVQARGKDVVNVLRWTLDNRKLPDSPPVEVKAGEKASFPLVIDCAQFKVGETHQLQAELVNPDLLPNNNVRYLTFAVRQPRHVLIITDDPSKARRWKEAHESLRALADFRVTTISPDKLLQEQKDNPGVLTKYQAVYLFDVAEPSADLWSLLAGYVGQGGGVGIVPGGKELVPSAYRSKEALDVMPGELLGTRDSSRDKGKWDWETIEYQHPMMAPFQAWKGDRGTDFVARPPSAVRYWDVKPGAGKPLVRYVSGAPALLVGTRGKEGRPGKVVLFTTALDEREPAWNDYLSTLTSFPVVLAFVSTTYLAGDAEPVQLNFLSGQGVPVVALPLAQRGSSDSYRLWRNGTPAEPVTAERGQGLLRLPQAQAPGLYSVAGEGGKEVAAFSVNLPPDEVVPVRLPAAAVEALFGQGAVVPVDVRADLRAAMSGQWSQPVELFPFLMVLVLFVLAVENLLANKFYRREPEAAA